MDAISQTTFFKRMFMNEKLCIFIRISLKFVPWGPINNKSALVQLMAWHQTGDKPLFEPMLTQFTDTMLRHQGEMSKLCLGTAALLSSTLLWTNVTQLNLRRISKWFPIYGNNPSYTRYADYFKSYAYKQTSLQTAKVNHHCIVQRTQIFLSRMI